MRIGIDCLIYFAFLSPAFLSPAFLSVSLQILFSLELFSGSGLWFSRTLIRFSVDRYRLPRYDEYISNTESVSLHEYHPVEKPFQTNRFSASDVFSPAGISFCSLEFRLSRTEYPIDTGSRTYSIRLSICEFILQRAEGSSYRHLSGCRTRRRCRSAMRRSDHDD